LRRAGARRSHEKLCGFGVLLRRALADLVKRVLGKSDFF